MAIALKELVKLVESFGYKVSSPRQSNQDASVVDELLGEFEGALLEGKTSTDHLRELRDSGYGRY